MESISYTFSKFWKQAEQVVLKYSLKSNSNNYLILFWFIDKQQKVQTATREKKMWSFKFCKQAEQVVLKYSFNSNSNNYLILFWFHDKQQKV